MTVDKIQHSQIVNGFTAGRAPSKVFSLAQVLYRICVLTFFCSYRVYSYYMMNVYSQHYVTVCILPVSTLHWVSHRLCGSMV